MQRRFPQFNQCLEHQLPEDQASPAGLVCACCKHRLYVAPPTGHSSAYWESQPAAYSLDGEPCFVYVLTWEDFRIRALHPPRSTTDPRGPRLRQMEFEAASAEPELFPESEFDESV